MTTSIKNKIELTDFDLKLISKDEANSTNGGWWPFAVTYVLIEAALNPRAHMKAFKEGFYN